MLLGALLTGRDLDSFRRFEHADAVIMARHGGAIERALVLPGESLRELHLVRFQTPRRSRPTAKIQR